MRDFPSKQLDNCSFTWLCIIVLGRSTVVIINVFIMFVSKYCIMFTWTIL